MTTAIEAVDLATASVAHFKPLNELPDKGADGKVIYPYGSFTATLGRGDTYTLDDAEGIRWGRVVVQTFGRTSTSALLMAEQVRAALVGTSLAITGYSTSGLRSELDPTVVRDPDDSGVVGVTATYTFTATQEA